MQINHNISALIANAHLKNTNKALDKSMERLSSGFRINRAADDAAGMAISQKMKTQIAGLEQASRNASDGISVIQTAEGALGEVQAILQRARELSVQSANGTNTAEDRDAIQKEIDQLMQEVDRISTDTEFNTKSLLNGSIGRKSYSDKVEVSLISASESVATGDYVIKSITVGEVAELKGSSIGNSNFTFEKEEVGNVVINGEIVEIKEGDTRNEAVQKIREACERANINLDSSSNQLVFQTMEAGADQSITIYCENTELAGKLGIKNIVGDKKKAEGTPPRCR